MQEATLFEEMGGVLPDEVRIIASVDVFVYLNLYPYAFM